MASADREELLRAHRQDSMMHREQVLRSDLCGCFFCLRVFHPDAIKEWCDGDQTALCPHCGIDAVLGSASGRAITSGYLAAMRGEFF